MNTQDESGGPIETTSAPEQGSTLYLTVVCTVAALGGLLFGFDTAVISGARGLLVEQFKLDEWMEGWVVSSVLLGCITGAMAAGTLSDRFGRKKMMILAAGLFLISAIGSTLPQSPGMLIVVRLLGGLGVGFASMLSPLYISELSPPHLRPSRHLFPRKKSHRARRAPAMGTGIRHLGRPPVSLPPTHRRPPA